MLDSGYAAHSKPEEKGKPMDINALLLDLSLRLKALSPFRYTATKCGHRTRRTGPVSVFGKTITLQMSLGKNRRPDYCLDCIAKMAIRCAWCGKPIFIGRPITLNTPHESNFQIPEYAVVYDEDPPQLVGCFSQGCADAMDLAGFWMPGEGGKGYVHLVYRGTPILMPDANETSKPTPVPLQDCQTQ